MFSYLPDNFVLLHENDFYVWFIAKNDLGNYFVASLIEEDEDNGHLIYLYNFVSNDNLKRFLNYEISYRELIMCSDELYIIMQHYNYEIFNTEKITLENEKMCFSHPTLYAPKRKYKEINLFISLFNN